MQNQPIIFSRSFGSFLRKNQARSKVCDVLVRINDRLIYNHFTSNILTDSEVNYLTFRNNGNISYLPAGKEHQLNDQGEWKKEGRQEGKPAKVIRKLFTKQGLKRLFKDSDFEVFSNTYKASFSLDGFEFNLLDNISIPDVYDMPVLPGGGSLNGSCMNGCGHYLNIYVNCSKLKILTLSKCGELAGRALVWFLDDMVFMDRVYSVEDRFSIAFIDYATTQKWWYKVHHDTFRYKDSLINPDTGQAEVKRLKVSLSTEFDEYPYIDTFTYGGRGFLANYRNSDCLYEYDNTNGYRNDVGAWDDISEEVISPYDVVEIDRGEYSGQNTHIANTVIIDGERWWRDDSDIVEINGSYYHVDDCICFRGDYYPTEDCVYSDHHEEYIPNEYAVEVCGNYFYRTDVNEV